MKIKRRILMLFVVGLLAASGCGAQPSAAQLRFSGELRHNWRGPVAGACRLLAQAFDAPVNGAVLGTAYQSAAQTLAAGALQFDVPASAFPATAAPVWLRLGVRCADTGDATVWMAPRLEHRGALIIGGVDRRAFLCAMPGGTAGSADATPTIEGSDYTLSGAFTVQQ